MPPPPGQFAVDFQGDKPHGIAQPERGGVIQAGVPALAGGPAHQRAQLSQGHRAELGRLRHRQHLGEGEEAGAAVEVPNWLPEVSGGSP